MRKKFVNRQGIYGKFTKMVTNEIKRVYVESINGYHAVFFQVTFAH